jgi:hypothetical protein
MAYATMTVKQLREERARLGWGRGGDRTKAQLIADFAHEDERVTLIHKRNAGPLVALPFRAVEQHEAAARFRMIQHRQLVNFESDWNKHQYVCFAPSAALIAAMRAEFHDDVFVQPATAMVEARLKEFSIRLGSIVKQFEELRQDIRSDDHACTVMVSDDLSLNSRLRDAKSALADAEIALAETILKAR